MGNKAKLGDMGIDGRIYPISAIPKASGESVGELDFADLWYPIQVKQKDKAGRPSKAVAIYSSSSSIAASIRSIASSTNSRGAWPAWDAPRSRQSICRTASQNKTPSPLGLPEVGEIIPEGISLVFR